MSTPSTPSPLSGQRPARPTFGTRLGQRSPCGCCTTALARPLPPRRRPSSSASSSSKTPREPTRTRRAARACTTVAIRCSSAESCSAGSGSLVVTMAVAATPMTTKALPATRRMSRTWRLARLLMRCTTRSASVGLTLPSSPPMGCCADSCPAAGRRCTRSMPSSTSVARRGTLASSIPASGATPRSACPSACAGRRRIGRTVRIRSLLLRCTLS
mmetsp:Transcript_118861/g.296480  ORF Transcript_118861/g.296480 Transcript_118861/m.296480 type:complete len:215 (-) Transcript_118861:744-1388(-)